MLPRWPILQRRRDILVRTHVLPPHDGGWGLPSSNNAQEQPYYVPPPEGLAVYPVDMGDLCETKSEVQTSGPG